MKIIRRRSPLFSVFPPEQSCTVHAALPAESGHSASSQRPAACILAPVITDNLLNLLSRFLNWFWKNRIISVPASVCGRICPLQMAESAFLVKSRHFWGKIFSSVKTFLPIFKGFANLLFHKFLSGQTPEETECILRMAFSPAERFRQTKGKNLETWTAV